MNVVGSSSMGLHVLVRLIMEVRGHSSEVE